MRNSTTSLWSGLRVGQKLATIPLLFIFAITGILLYTFVTAQDQKLDSEMVRMTARQRVLNQRHFLQVLLISQGHEPNYRMPQTLDKHALLNAIETLNYQATRRLLFDSLDSLINGGPVLDLSAGEEVYLPPAPTPEIKARLLEQKSALTAFKTTADRFLKLKTGDANYDAMLIQLMNQCRQAEAAGALATKAMAANSQDKIATMIQWEVALSAIVAIAGLLFSVLVTRAIVNPLGSVVGLAKCIAQGDLRGQKLPAGSTDEVGQLAAVFNEMLDGLKTLATQTVGVTDNLNAAAAEILASTQQQAAGTKQQAATVQQITTTMEEVQQSGSQISDRAREVATTAEATSASSVAGLNAVQETNRTMESIREQIEEVAENIVALSEKTQAVGEIIATVNDIAERSNLLALNAAIEAAAAGEYGNRFSVVAGEMKNLADQAKESTLQVRTILGDIQKGINGSVMLAEEAVKRSDAGKQQADITDQTIRKMAETTQASVQAFQQIIGATNQQLIGFEQVTQGMQDIRQTASQTAASTVQLEKAMASLNTQSNQLREAVSCYRV